MRHKAMRHGRRELSLLLMLVACGDTRGVDPGSPPTPPPEAVPPAREGASPPPAAWVQARVTEATARMARSDGGRLVASAIEAHGGLSSWLSAGTIAYEFDYRPLDQPERRMRTYQRVDLWSARAHHEERGVLGDTPAGGPTTAAGAINEPLATFGWDGREAWISPEASAFPSSARFWALTPYFFVGMPFVAADPGTRYERLDDRELDGVTHHLVKLTYETDVGDAPGDYYILYLHPETHRLSALRYVVSFPGFFAPGEHSPEKLMRYTEPVAAGGMTFASRYDTFAWSADTGAGERVTEVALSELTLGESWSDELFARPEGAEVSALVPRSE